MKLRLRITTVFLVILLLLSYIQPNSEKQKLKVLYYSLTIASHKSVNEALVLELALNPSFEVYFITCYNRTHNAQEFIDRGVKLLEPQFVVETDEEEKKAWEMINSSNISSLTFQSLMSFHKLLRDNYKFDLLVTDVQSIGQNMIKFLNTPQFIFVSNAPIDASLTMHRNLPPPHSSQYSLCNYIFYKFKDPYPLNLWSLRVVTFVSNILSTYFSRQLLDPFCEMLDTKYAFNELPQARISLTLNIEGINPPIPVKTKQIQKEYHNVKLRSVQFIYFLRGFKLNYLCLVKSERKGLFMLKTQRKYVHFAIFREEIISICDNMRIFILLLQLYNQLQSRLEKKENKITKKIRDPSSQHIIL